jgi:hypothetical protein
MFLSYHKNRGIHNDEVVLDQTLITPSITTLDHIKREEGPYGGMVVDRAPLGTPKVFDI